jgi:hypothetical protein
MHGRRAWWWAGALLLAAACQRGGDGGQARRTAAAPARGEAGRPEAGRSTDTGGDQGQVAARAGAAGAVQQVQGKVARASDTEVEIRQADQPAITLRVGPSTAVTVDGRRASAAQLQPGMEVRASYGADRTAIEVRELPPPKAGAAGTVNGAHGGQGGSPAGEDRFPRGGGR